MATRTPRWNAAVATVCRELEAYAAHRDAGRSVLETAFAMRIERGTATQYERTLSAMLATLTTDNPTNSTAPDLPGPRAATAPTK